MELKGSLDQGLGQLFAPNGDEASPSQDASLQGAREALLSMGFTSAEVDLSLKGSPEGAGEEALLKYALKRLGQVS